MTGAFGVSWFGKSMDLNVPWPEIQEYPGVERFVRLSSHHILAQYHTITSVRNTASLELLPLRTLTRVVWGQYQACTSLQKTRKPETLSAKPYKP